MTNTIYGMRPYFLKLIFWFELHANNWRPIK